MYVANGESAKVETWQQTPSPRRGRPAVKLYLCSAAITAGLSDKNVSYNSVKMTQKICFLMVHTAGTWGPNYKTLRSACEVLVVKNKMGEQNKRLSDHKPY